jgi:hypothetical protein
VWKHVCEEEIVNAKPKVAMVEWDQTLVDVCVMTCGRKNCYLRLIMKKLI